MNRFLGFANRWGDGLACGIYSSTVLSVYIYVLLGEGGAGIEGVGIAQAVQGILAVSCAQLAGSLTGRVRKDVILRVLALAQCAAIALTCMVMLNDDWDSSRKFLLLCVGLALWGVGQANSPIVDVLFADSVPAAAARAMYSRLHMGYIVSQVLGPAVAASVFLYTGDTWDTIAMQQVVLVGMITACIPAATLLFFNDDWALRTDRQAPARRHSRAHSPRPRDQASSRDDPPGRRRQAAGDEQLTRALLAGDVEDGGVGASNMSQAGAWKTEDEQNLEGFDNMTFKSPAGSGPSSQEASPARPVIPVHVHGLAAADSPSSDAPGGGSPDAKPSVAPGPEDVGSHALDIGDTLSDSMSSLAASAASGKPPRPAASMDRGMAMASLDEDKAVSFGDSGLQKLGSGGLGNAAASFVLQRSGVGSGSASPTSPVVYEAGLGAVADQLQEPSFSTLLPMRSQCPVHGTAGSAANPRGKEEGAPEDGRTAACTCWQAGPGRSSSKQLLAAGRDSFSLLPIPEHTRNGAPLVTPTLGKTNFMWEDREEDDACASGQQQQMEVEPHAITSPFKSAAASGGAAVGDAQPASSQKPQRQLAAAGVASRRMARRLSRDESWRPNAAGPCCSYDMSWIPGVLAITDLIMGFAAGMTIKFFPIFFMSEVHLAPSTLCLFYSIVPLALSVFGYLTQAASRYLGRGPIVALNRLIGIVLLFIIAWRPDIWLLPQLVVPICIVRAAVMNCNYAVEKSILLDYTGHGPGNGWSSLEAFTSFGWSAAALLGGWFISTYGFQSAFFATGVLQTIGWLVSLLLLPLIPRSELSVDEIAIILSKLKSLQKCEARVPR